MIRPIKLMIFDYPSTFIAKYSPWGYIRYSSYKDWLRDEFGFRCVYCLTREMWCPTGHRVFAVEHIRPKVNNKKRINVYENLTYSCHLCNSLKGTKVTLNPRIDPLGDHLKVNLDGTINGITSQGKKMVLLLGLDDPERNALRKKYIDIYNAFQDPVLNTHHLIINLYHGVFGYPVLTPNLKAKNPPGLKNKKSVNRCCYQRHHGKLPRPVYLM